MSRLPGRLRLLRRVLALILACGAVLATAATSAVAQAESDGRAVDILPLEGFVDPPVAGAIVDLIEQANDRGSELVVVQLDSAGVVSADVAELVEAIRASSVPVVVFVGPRGVTPEAAGGAAVVALAAHGLAMSEDATLGPIEPVDLAGGSTAAPALVGERLDTVPALRTGALTARQLEAAGLDVIEASGLEPLLVELDGRTLDTAAGAVDLRIRSEEIVPRLHSLGLWRRMLHAAATPAFIYLLFAAGLTMLLFEVFQPGFGVAGLAGVVMAGIGGFGLTVLPVTWWAVALVVLGLLLYAVDVAIAGFGPVTAAATAAFAAGSWWFYDDPTLTLPGWLVGATTLAALVFFVGVMTAVLRAQAGPDTAAVGDLVGKVGMVRSVLNPEGHVYIDGALWRARWTGEGRRAKVGTPVRVHGVDGPLVLVDRFVPERAEAASTR